ncbi:putative Uncharacterized transporter [Glarea lozoyensis 74030]|nr:putative Uncharacterized transporter [Glarea lozoyensis 74030]
MGPVGGAFGGLLASGIFKLDRFGSLHDWRMLFAIEGIITIGLALIGFFTMTDRPETARWLSPAEKELAVRRIMSERIGTTEVLDKMDRQKTLRGIFNPTVLATGFIFLLTNITVQGLGFFLPTIIRTIYPKSTLISQQLHTVPPYAVGTFFTIAIPLLSWRYDNRNAFIMLSAPLVIAGYIMFLATNNAQVRYGATFLIASGAFANGALCNAQVSANVISDTARSSAIGITVMMGNLGGLIATWSFLLFDGPDYHIGNGLNLATSTTILFTSLLLTLWMVRDNKKRERIDAEEKLRGLSQKQVQDLDWRHPDFRWKP